MDSQVSSSAASPAAASATSAPRETAFRAVTGAEPETASAAVLLTAAYCVLWVLLMAFIWLTWRRQRSLSDQLTTLEKTVKTESAEPRGR